MVRDDKDWKAELQEASRARRPVRVLLAEDDRDLCELLASILRKDGYEVLLANDGGQLVDIIASSITKSSAPIDLLISDIRMPGWTGLQVLSAIREIDWSLPVILITGYKEFETLKEASRLGATAIFLKPFEIDDLRTAIFNFLPTEPTRPGAHPPSP